MQIEIPVAPNSQTQQEEEKVNLEIESFSKISQHNKIDLSQKLLTIAEENAHLQIPEESPSENKVEPYEDSSRISSQSGQMMIFTKEDNGNISA